MLIWGFLCQITIVMMRYTRNLIIMYAWKVIHEIQNVLHSCPYYSMHKIMRFSGLWILRRVGWWHTSVSECCIKLEIARRRRRWMNQCFFLRPPPLRKSFLEKQKKQKLQQLLLLLQEGVMKRKWSKEEALVRPYPPAPHPNLRRIHKPKK